MKKKLIIRIFMIVGVISFFSVILIITDLIAKSEIKPMLFCDREKIQFKKFEDKLYKTTDKGLSWVEIKDKNNNSSVEIYQTNKLNNNIQIINKKLIFNKLFLDIKAESSMKCELKIFSIKGANIYNSNFIVKNGLNNISIDLNDWFKGIYFFTIVSNDINYCDSFIYY